MSTVGNLRPILPDFFAADEKLIYFNSPGKLFAILAYGAASELLQPTPSGGISAKSQKFFEIYSIDPWFSRGEPPHGFEPLSDWFF